MRIQKKTDKILEPDMTPMIDMTFQLIAFFMVIINFTVSEQNQAIQLPKSELAKPQDQPIKDLLTLQVTRPDDKDGKTYVFFAGSRMEVVPMSAGGGQILSQLQKEKQLLQLKEKTPGDATIIIRGDSFAQTGRVQELIAVCQEVGFENFALRARQEREK